MGYIRFAWRREGEFTSIFRVCDIKKWNWFANSSVSRSSHSRSSLRTLPLFVLVQHHGSIFLVFNGNIQCASLLKLLQNSVFLCLDYVIEHHSPLDANGSPPCLHILANGLYMCKSLGVIVVRPWAIKQVALSVRLPCLSISIPFTFVRLPESDTFGTPAVLL